VHRIAASDGPFASDAPMIACYPPSRIEDPDPSLTTGRFPVA